VSTILLCIISNSLELRPFLTSHHFCGDSRIFQHFMEPRGSLLCSQEPSTGPYPEPDQSSPYHPILSKINFNIIHPPRSWFSSGIFAFWLPHQYATCISLLHHLCYMPCPSHPPWFDHSNYTWQRAQVMKHLVMHFSPICCHFISLKSKYSVPCSQRLNVTPLLSEIKLHTHIEPQAKL
jgi:hypothetical protein